MQLMGTPKVGGTQGKGLIYPPRQEISNIGKGIAAGIAPWRCVRLVVANSMVQ